MVLAWLLALDQWLEAATEVLCMVFWALAGALAVIEIVRFFMWRR